MLCEAAAAYRIAVLGAGVAGSVCASRLANIPGVATTVYDMGSRGPGGRASSRPVDGSGGSFSPADKGGVSTLAAPDDAAPLIFDHGVQGFTVTDAEVQALADEWLQDGHVGAWEGRFGVVDGTTGAFKLSTGEAADDPFGLLADGRPCYVGVPSMAHLVRGMLDHASATAQPSASPPALTQLPSCKATRVTYANEGEAPEGSRWTVESSDGVERGFDAVVVAGHAASFAADIAAQLPGAANDERLAALRTVSYPHGTAPLFALLVAFCEPLGAAGTRHTRLLPVQPPLLTTSGARSVATARRSRALRRSELRQLARPALALARLEQARPRAHRRARALGRAVDRGVCPAGGAGGPARKGAQGAGWRAAE